MAIVSPPVSTKTEHTTTWNSYAIGALESLASGLGVAQRNEISVALVTTLITALRVFDLIYVTTLGGPGNQTMVASLWLYRNAFQQNRVGYAATIAVVLTLIILLISYLVITLRLRTASEA